MFLKTFLKNKELVLREIFLNVSAYKVVKLKQIYNQSKNLEY